MQRLLLHRPLTLTSEHTDRSNQPGLSITFQRLDLLVLGLLDLVCDLGDDEVLAAGQLDGLDQHVQPVGVVAQEVQQGAGAPGLRGLGGHLLCVVPRHDAAGAQVVEVALGSDLGDQVGPQFVQHLDEKEANHLVDGGSQPGL